MHVVLFNADKEEEDDKAYLHRDRFFLPGTFPIAAEQHRSVSIANAFKDDFYLVSNSFLQQLSPTMLNPPIVRGIDGRKGSVASTSSSRSGFEGGASLRTPTVSSIRKIAGDRESMQTPRPQMHESKTVRPTPQSGSAQNISRDSTDRTISPTDVIAPESSHAQRQSSESPSNAIGRTSLSSAGHGGRQSISEYGERPTTSSSVRKNRKKTVAPPEMLVIVKPPPSKQVNPMNLQIQLVIPQATSTTATSKASFDSSRDETLIPPSASSNSNGLASSNSTNSNALSAPNTPTSNRPLKRSSSINSSRSTRSARSDVSSGAYSATSSNSANRRVTPLYNLNFHNITATTVTDAGTDEKVAKFGKRGVDLDGFGQLEPHELLLGVNDLSTLMSRRMSAPKSTATAPTVISNYSGSDPASNAVSIPARSQTTGLEVPNLEEPPTSFDAMSPEAKNPTDGGLGGKFSNKFKRFSIGAGQNLGGKLSSMGTQSAASLRSGVSNQEAPSGLLAKMSSVASTKGADIVDDRSDSFSRKDAIPGAQGLGQSLGVDVPQLVPGGGLRSDGRRTEGYFWTVRKWNRRSGMDDDEERDTRLEEPGSNPVLNSVWKRFNMVNRMGGQEVHPHCREVPIRFEWTRNAERRKSSVVSSGHAKSNTDSGAAARNRASRLSFSRASMDVKSSGEANTDSAEAFRSNLRPPKSTSNSRPSSIHSNSSSAAPYRVSMEQSGSQVGSAENDEDSDPEDSEVTWSCHLVLSPTTRIPIGSLSPTPHHPKLIGQLSIPFPLPDLSQAGIGADGAGLTREELKDIISITCLFVVVREGFGGLVKKKRVQGTK
jgi:hypothetical protein